MSLKMETVACFNYFIKEIDKLRDYMENEVNKMSNVKELDKDKIFECNRFVTLYIDMLEQFDVKSFEELLSVFQKEQIYSNFETIIKTTFENWDKAINRINKIYVDSFKDEPGYDHNLKLDEISFETIPDKKPYRLSDHTESYKLIVLLRHFQ